MTHTYTHSYTESDTHTHMITQNITNNTYITAIINIIKSHINFCDETVNRVSKRHESVTKRPINFIVRDETGTSVTNRFSCDEPVRHVTKRLAFSDTTHSVHTLAHGT